MNTSGWRASGASEKLLRAVEAADDLAFRVEFLETNEGNIHEEWYDPESEEFDVAWDRLAELTGGYSETIQ